MLNPFLTIKLNSDKYLISKLQNPTLPNVGFRLCLVLYIICIVQLRQWHQSIGRVLNTTYWYLLDVYREPLPIFSKMAFLPTFYGTESTVRHIISVWQVWEFHIWKERVRKPLNRCHLNLYKHLAIDPWAERINVSVLPYEVYAIMFGIFKFEFNMFLIWF